MNSIRQIFILTKRILSRPIIPVILMLIPVLLIIVRSLPAKSQNTDIVSGFYIEDPDTYSEAFADYITSASTGFIFRQYSSLSEMTDDVSSGSIDSGYTLPSGISSSIIQQDDRIHISVITTPGTSFQEVSSEAVYAALLKTYAPAMSVYMLRHSYIPDSAGVSADHIHKYISEHFDKYISDSDVFTISSSLSGRYISSDMITPNNFPVNILVIITVMVCGLLGLQNYLKDLDDGVYSVLTKAGRSSFCAKNIAAGIIPAAIINLISMLLYSGLSCIGRTLAFILLSSAAVFVLCILLRLVFRRYRIYMTAMPFIIICTVLLSLLYWLSQK